VGGGAQTRARRRPRRAGGGGGGGVVAAPGRPRPARPRSRRPQALRVTNDCEVYVHAGTVLPSLASHVRLYDETCALTSLPAAPQAAARARAHELAFALEWPAHGRYQRLRFGRVPAAVHGPLHCTPPSVPTRACGVQTLHFGLRHFAQHVAARVLSADLLVASSGK
jgi:hypothetical protein